jgi:hypothetical protein
MNSLDLAPHTFEALRWFVRVLERHHVRYQIAGGFAARIYGSRRKLNDIDFDISEHDFAVIMPEIASYIKEGPEHLNDGKWDGVFVLHNYKGQEIDIGAIETMRISNKSRTAWIPYSTEYVNPVEREIDGLRLSVLSPGTLAAYKRELDGDHQLVDIEAIQKGAAQTYHE